MFEINGLFESCVIGYRPQRIGLAGTLLPTDRSGELIHGVRYRGCRFRKLDSSIAMV
jgi:hypothetical protein